MTEKREQGQVKRTILACIFCGLLFVLLVLHFALPDRDFSDTEKRVLADFPEVRFSSIADGTFESEIESYVQDQMPLRNFWVGLCSYFNFYAGQNGVDGFYVCKDDYLINTPAKENPRNLQTNLKYLNQFAEKNNLPCFMEIVPETGYVMKDVLPAKHETYKDDALFAQIQNSLSHKISFVDLRDDFCQQAKEVQLFYRTDHHWTSDGALIGANAFLKAAERPQLKKSDFEVKSYDGFKGTIHSKAALWKKSGDVMELWYTSGEGISVEVSDLGKDEVTRRDQLFFLEHLEKYDRYPTYLNGNHSFTHIVNPNAPQGSLLMLKDSFGNTLATELAAAYREIVMVDLRYYRTKAVSDLIQEYGVDTILINYSADSIVNDTNILWLK